MIQEIRISVRNLVEFLLRSGSIDTGFMGSSRAVEGTKAHQKIQRSQGDEYEAEVLLKHRITYKGIVISVEGRADGIIMDEEGVTIDEIKSTTYGLELIDENYNPLHWAQAKVYGYIYALQNDLSQINIQLTYYQLDTEEIKRIHASFPINELEVFFMSLLDQYHKWAAMSGEWNIVRNESIKGLDFPFQVYRKGQRELAVAIYRTIQQEKKIFVQAPTGIGKTISTIFPAVKAMGEGYTSKIFYLTAKTITRQVAEEACLKMREKGLQFKSLTLTAKDKICFKEESICNPKYCQYAAGHFDRVNEAIMELLKNENLITREVVEKYARIHRICPFEFSLDLSLWVDAVICDYNYTFDPRVYLKRFFSDNKGDYVFLIDEAHNLVDRSREMFSAHLTKQPFLELKRRLKDKSPKISKALQKVNKYMIEARKKIKNKEGYIEKEEPKEIYPLLSHFIKTAEGWLVQNEMAEEYEALLELYFNALAFLKIGEFYDQRYVTYMEKEGNDLFLKLYCLDPSYLLGEATKRGKTAIFFSATLTPLDYYKDILGGGEEDYVIQLPSPFNPSHLSLMVANRISTRYRDRENSYKDVVELIFQTVDHKQGNYLVFFPSYKYMNEVAERFREKYPEKNVIQQETSMNEEAREVFLGQFQADRQESLVGFAVLGGIFSEGIDLKGERLVGSIIVGVGLPQLCLERDIIKNYFQNKNSKGYEYAYMYPGMNKVLQAAGRVIRSEQDKGVVLLIDQRFTYGAYQKLFPRYWSAYQIVKDSEALKLQLNRFWSNKKES